MTRLHVYKATYLLSSLAVVVADQWTKWWVERTLPLHVPREVIPGFLNFTHVRNTGVAFGLFAARDGPVTTVVLTIAGLAALSIVGIYFWRTPDRDRLMLISLGLILGGAVGNLVDRISTGAVTDFVDAYFGTYHWHTFNIADSAITVGIVLMAVDLIFSRTDDTKSEAEASLESPSRG